MHAPGEPGDLPYAVGCPAFTRELRQVQWPSTKNFKPDVPEKYDGRSHPSEFLSIYTIAVQAAGGRDDKILANYFPLVLKSNVRSWLRHLPDNSISSWAELCHQFISAFTGGHKPHGQESDLHLFAQKEGETLRKFIQRFTSVHYNIPDVHPAAVITVFHQNVHNRRMREEMAMHKVKDVSELYALADKCARAEEGRKLPGETIGAGGSDSDDSTPAKKNRRQNNKKRQGKEVLAGEQSGDGGGAKAAKNGSSGKEVAACSNCQAVAAADKQDCTNKQYCKIHRTKGHDLQSCKKVEQLVQLQRAEYERRDKEKAQGDTGGSGTKRPGRGGRRGKEKQQQGDRPPRGRDKDEDDDSEEMDDDETSEQEFQKATEVLCVDGGASLHASHRQLKQWVREVNAAEPPVESRRPLRWSSTPIIFDIEDHPDRTTAVACLPMLVSPTIRNLKVTKMLVDGGAGLNLISSAVLQKLQIPDSELKESGTFQGINPGRSKPKGKITLPMPGPISVITVHGDKKDALICADKVYWEAAAVADNKPLAAEAPGRKKKTKSGKSSGTHSGKRTSSECCATVEDAPSSSTGKCKKAMAAPPETKKVPAKEDGTGGYHQIFMAEEDEEKTAFITPCGTYCFVRMPFGLKNAGSTFARVVHTAFEPQIHRNVEAYMDDIVVKSKDKATLVQDLDETFANLRKINLKLNPEKCVFGVPSGKLLGFFVSQRGIEANPDKIKAIEQIEAPKRVKDVRKLAGCVAALSRFISRSAERALPFFKILKKAGPMQWTPEAEAALQDLKEYLSSTPVLVAPKPQKKLLLYLAATNQVVSAALVAEREADGEPATAASASSDEQGASPASSGPEKDGSAQEEVQKKMVQRPVYFNPEATGRIVEWELELSSFGLKFESISTIQSRALAEFIAEWKLTPDEETPETSIPVNEVSK
ncbi:unnamed protein product [Triticum aestivum]|uniref:Uncharacterized protein n=1 Tax=Triticum aestivum TaxID=4565 RepID=A0A7H4LP67_WHEAT|nr:unnamed protein product [Triticum aestivum]